MLLRLRGNAIQDRGGVPHKRSRRGSRTRLPPTGAKVQHVAEALEMPNEFVGQNGAVIREVTPITVTGCPKAVKAKAKKKKKGKGKGEKGKKGGKKK